MPETDYQKPQYKVTVAIPIYNVAQFVEKSIRSALDQTFASIEFLLIDDKGTDHSMEIVRELIATHPRRGDIRIVAHERNMGLAVARNTAIDCATGEYLYFLDSDDTIPANCIEVLCHQTTQHAVDFVAGSHHLVDDEGKVLESVVCDNLFIDGRFAIARQFFKKRVQKKYLFPIIACNKLFRRSFLIDNQIRCFPGYLHEDNPFTFDVILKAVSCCLISDVTYYYYSRQGSIMNQKVSDKKIDSIFFLLTYEKDRSKSYVNEDFYNDLLTETMIYRVWLFIPMYIDSLNAKRDKQRIKDILRYPVIWSQLKNMKYKKRIHHVLYLIGKMPFFAQRIALRLKYYMLMRRKYRLSPKK